MKPEELIKILGTASKLKENTRHSWLANGRQESVAEHCWRLSLFAYFVGDEYPDININRVIKMCIFHDMGEAFTGDIPSFYKTKSDENTENKVLDDWVNSLPEKYREELTEIFAEMRENTTYEAKLFNSLDKLEGAISHNEADLGTWLPLEYGLNPVYGYEQCQFSEYSKELQAQVRKDSLNKIKEEKQN